MERSEYTTVDFSKPSKADAELKRLRAAGWETVAMLTTWGDREWKLAHPIYVLRRGPDADRMPSTAQARPAA